MPPTCVPVPPEITSVPPLNPPLTPPAKDMLSAVSACVIDEVLPVVLPIADSPIEVAEATGAVPDMTIVPPLNPALMSPIPEIDISVRTLVVAEEEPVVFPNAVMFIEVALAACEAAPEMTSVLPDQPPLTPPVNEMLSAVIRRVVAELDPVVLPSAVTFIVEADAAVVAPEMMMLLPENPTLTPPAPDIVSAVRTRVVAEDEPVVLPVAVRFMDDAAAPTVAETISDPAE